MEDRISPRPISRRAVTKTVAWSIPVIAAAVASPAFAASTTTFTQTVSGTGAAKGTLTFSLPANATDITYTVIGGGGTQGASSATGSGAMITGALTLPPGSAAVTVSLVAAGAGSFSAGGDGYGPGGAPVVAPTSSATLQRIQPGVGGSGGSACCSTARPR